MAVATRRFSPHSRFSLCLCEAQREKLTQEKCRVWGAARNLGDFAKQMEAFSRQAKVNLLAAGKLACTRKFLKKLD